MRGICTQKRDIFVAAFFSEEEDEDNEDDEELKEDGFFSAELFSEEFKVVFVGVNAPAVVVGSKGVGLLIQD